MTLSFVTGAEECSSACVLSNREYICEGMGSDAEMEGGAEGRSWSRRIGEGGGEIQGEERGERGEWRWGL